MGDLIERLALLDALSTWDKFGCDADTKLVPYEDHYIPYIRYDDVIKCIKGLPSVGTEKTKIDWNYGEIKELTNNYHPAILNNYLEEDLCIKNLLPVSTEKTGYWIDVDGDNAICGCCNRLNRLYGRYCKHCGAKMVNPQESEE